MCAFSAKNFLFSVRSFPFKLFIPSFIFYSHSSCTNPASTLHVTSVTNKVVGSKPLQDISNELRLLEEASTWKEVANRVKSYKIQGILLATACNRIRILHEKELYEVNCVVYLEKLALQFKNLPLAQKIPKHGLMILQACVNAKVRNIRVYLLLLKDIAVANVFLSTEVVNASIIAIINISSFCKLSDDDNSLMKTYFKTLVMEARKIPGICFTPSDLAVIIPSLYKFLYPETILINYFIDLALEVADKLSAQEIFNIIHALSKMKLAEKEIIVKLCRHIPAARGDLSNKSAITLLFDLKKIDISDRAVQSFILLNRSFLSSLKYEDFAECFVFFSDENISEPHILDSFLQSFSNYANSCSLSDLKETVLLFGHRTLRTDLTDYIAGVISKAVLKLDSKMKNEFLSFAFTNLGKFQLKLIDLIFRQTDISAHLLYSYILGFSATCVTYNDMSLAVELAKKILPHLDKFSSIQRAEIFFACGKIGITGDFVVRLYTELTFNDATPLYISSALLTVAKLLIPNKSINIHQLVIAATYMVEKNLFSMLELIDTLWSFVVLSNNAYDAPFNLQLFFGSKMFTLYNILNLNSAVHLERVLHCAFLFHNLFDLKSLQLLEAHFIKLCSTDLTYYYSGKDEFYFSILEEIKSILKKNFGSDSIFIDQICHDNSFSGIFKTEFCFRHPSVPFPIYVVLDTLDSFSVTVPSRTFLSNGKLMLSRKLFSRTHCSRIFVSVFEWTLLNKSTMQAYLLKKCDECVFNYNKLISAK